eukprot:3471297-Amphidinium_carterae.1
MKQKMLVAMVTANDAVSITTAAINKDLCLPCRSSSSLRVGCKGQKTLSHFGSFSSLHPHSERWLQRQQFPFMEVNNISQHDLFQASCSVL